MWKLDGMAIVSVSAPPLRAMRTKSLIRRDPTDHWVITIGKRAATGLISERDQTLVPAGVPFVLSLGDFSANQRGLDDRIQLNISGTIRRIAPALDAARGRTVSTPLGGMLSEYIRLLERQLPGLTDEDAKGLPQAIAAMVAACVAPSVDRIVRHKGKSAPPSRTRHGVVSSAICVLLIWGRACCAVNWECPGRVSYRLLETEGGVERYIQRHRLAESFAQLSDPSNTQSIVAIGDELGMLDPSSFSRAFRRQFGISPTDVREAVRAGLAPSLAAARRDTWSGVGGLLSRL